LQIRSGMAKQEWEVSEFPIVCKNCLGENPYVRMMKSYFNKECKICFRPFTVFRWRAGTNARYKKTEICQTCAKIRNVCQCCLLDLEYNLPVEIRDRFMENMPRLELPKDEVNRDLWVHEMAKNIDKIELPYGKEKPQEILDKLARTEPNYENNKPHYCSFFAKGTCNRGKYCPYRHGLKSEGKEESTETSYEGVEDPIAKRILERVKEDQGPAPPEDITNTTLYIGGITDKIAEKDLKVALGSYGRLKSVKAVYKYGCAFVTFAARQGAELAMQGLHERFFLKNTPLKVLWGKKQSESYKFAMKKLKEEEKEDDDVVIDHKTKVYEFRNTIKESGDEKQPAKVPNHMESIEEQLEEIEVTIYLKVV